MNRQELSRHLAHYEIFKRILHVHGSIIECGVRRGSTLLTWSNLSATFEPYNHTRRVIGFDTFQGFPSVTQSDIRGGHPDATVGGMNDSDLDALRAEIAAFDANRPIGHIPKIELVVGDACETIPQYVMEHPHLGVALLHLDFDICEPTEVALRRFVPLMPKGAVIVFDELFNERWPGETVAFKRFAALGDFRIRRFPWASTLSYAVIE